MEHHTNRNPNSSIPLPSPPSTLISNLITSPHTNALLTLLTLTLALLYIHTDYKSFLALGPGGTPSTPLGYLKIKILSILQLRDPLRPIPIPPHYRPQRGYLSTPLPPRPGSRPQIRGIAPQRQQSQKASQEAYTALVSTLQALVRDPSNLLVERTSCFEKHSSGLFSTAPITRICGGEICHVHPSDGSMHMTLHPWDVGVLIESGWGERHPLAKGGWFRRFVPKEFVLVYAPRSEEEVEVVRRIVAASVWWVSGRDVLGKKGEMRTRRGEGEGVEMEKERAREENVCWSCRVQGFGEGGKDELVGSA